MGSDIKRLNLIAWLGVISIISFILVIILLNVGIKFTYSDADQMYYTTISVAGVFGFIFSILFLIMNIVATVKTMTQNWKSKWCLKYNVTFAILGLFFGWLIFFIFAGVGKVKIKQEFFNLLPSESDIKNDQNM